LAISRPFPCSSYSVRIYAKASLQVNDLKELIAWLTVNPNKASAGIIAAVTIVPPAERHVRLSGAF
jgi:hypothetical protein